MNGKLFEVLWKLAICVLVVLVVRKSKVVKRKKLLFDKAMRFRVLKNIVHTCDVAKRKVLLCLFQFD